MVRVFTAFSGYDSQCLALERADIEYDLVGWSEIDKFAIKAHDTLFPQFKDRNYGDISKIDWETVPDFDLFTYSSPCQDFSIAGKMRGGKEGSGTRITAYNDIAETIISLDCKRRDLLVAICKMCRCKADKCDNCINLCNFTPKED